MILLTEKTIDIWKRKLDRIVYQGGTALINAYPDYMNFTNKKHCAVEFAKSRDEGQ